jgi:hypothetical protein
LILIHQWNARYHIIENLTYQERAIKDNGKTSFAGILSKNRGKFPKFVLSSAENALDSNFGNFLPQNIEMIHSSGIIAPSYLLVQVG